MKHLLKIYVTLAGGILATTLALVMTIQLTKRTPIAPTVPIQQHAAETVQLGTDLQLPAIGNDEVGLTVRVAGLDSLGPTAILAHVSIVHKADPTQHFDVSNLTLQRGPEGKYFGVMAAPQPPQLYINTPVFVFIKAEKHLQRKFDTTLTMAQYVDLTSKILEAGDIDQDGKVDSSDIEYIKSKIFSTTDGMADLNYDGTVNAGDMSLMLNTLSSKEDEQ